METWNNNQFGDNYITTKLDMFLATPSWINLYSRYTNDHLPKICSDHNPIMMTYKLPLEHNTSTTKIYQT